jgi:hypothetical protein
MHSSQRGGASRCLAVCADVELTSNLAPVAKWHYTNCSRNSRPTILAAR